MLILAYSAFAEDITDPQSYELNRRYEAGDVVKKMAFDINGDGVTDVFFNIVEANPDPTTAISDAQNGGTISWDAYVSVPNSNKFKVCTTLEESDNPGGLLRGVGLDINPNQMYVGNISEINRLGIVTSAVKRSASANSTIIYAYTWEGDHFKRWKLAEYITGQQNTIFDKYLKEGKRTQITVQQVKP